MQPLSSVSVLLPVMLYVFVGKLLHATDISDIFACLKFIID